MVKMRPPRYLSGFFNEVKSKLLTKIITYLGGQELDEALENLRECCASLNEVSRTTKAMQQSAIDHVSNSRRRCEEERKAKEEKGEENKGAQEPSYYANYATSIEHALVCAAEMTRHTS